MKKATALILTFVTTILSFCSCGRIVTSEKSTPVLTYLYNNGEGHQAVGEYIQTALKIAGIRVSLKNQEWGIFLSTRKSGDYIMARSGWLADHSDPITFLDMWVSSSGNNDAGLGKGAHASLRIYDLDLTDYGYDIKVENGTWSETYDRLIETIGECRDQEKRYALMHLAEDMIIDTGCIMPLYYYTDIYMVDSSLSGFFTNPLGYKYFMYTKYGASDPISVSLASEPASMDPALSSTVDSATMLSHLFSGLAKWEKTGDRTIIVPDSAEELPDSVLNDDGTVTYTYRLRSGLRWSDGVPLSAKDFEFAWKRAASKELGADYAYMFESIQGYGTDAGLSVKALDDRTLTVTLDRYVPYWNELLAFPTFFPTREDITADEKWATSASNYVSNGPYKLTRWEHNGRIVLSKNENYLDKDKIIPPSISFYLSDDANNMLTNFKNGTLCLIDSIPINEIDALKKRYPDELKVEGQLGTYYVVWNVNAPLLPPDSSRSPEQTARAEAGIRKAVSLLIDRSYICDSLAGGGQVPASSFVAMGIKNPDGSEFYQTAGGEKNYYGYFDTSREAFGKNTSYALSVLKKYYKLEIP